MSDSYSLYEINEYLQVKLEMNDINNIKLFACKDKSKISITLLPLTEKEDEYHGLHPKFNIQHLLKFISNNDVNSTDRFWSNVSNLQEKNKLMNLVVDEYNQDNEQMLSLFNIEGKPNLEKVLLGRAILQMSSRFGFKIKIEDIQLAKNFIDKIYIEWNKNSNYFKLFDDNKNNNLFWKYNEDTSEIWLLGIWPKEIIDSLSKEYTIESNDNELILKAENISIGNESNTLELVLSFNSNYLRYFRVFNSNIYYSGVMPKVRHIRSNDDIKYSNNVRSITLKVIRTTFATVDFMDNPLMINHTHFKNAANKYDLMKEFDNYEDRIQQKYLYASSCDEKQNQNSNYEVKEIEKINLYLSRSLNTNTIAVSSNIVTSDELLIVGKRADSSIDGGEYYCSVNGQSEFKDENVDFYYQSVYEDLPSLEYNSIYRIDLDNEIKRETIAELGICNLNSVWEYYGVSYLSKNNFPLKSNDNINLDESTLINKRRMHFNVLSSNRTDLNYKEVLMNSNNAIEKFENSKILGLKISLYRNKSHKIKGNFMKFYKWIENNSSRIFLFILFLTVVLNKAILTYDDLGSIIQFILLIIYLFIISKEWYGERNIRKLQTKINYTLTSNNDNMRDEFFKVIQNKSEGKNNVKLHAIFYLMVILFLEDKLKDLT